LRFYQFFYEISRMIQLTNFIKWMRNKTLLLWLEITMQNPPHNHSDTFITAYFLCCRRDFVHFAEICFKSFGGRVKYWTTINEPSLVTINAYMKGTYPPGHCSPPFGNCSAGNSDIEPLIVMHNRLLSHAKAVELYRKHFQVKKKVLTYNLLSPFRRKKD